MVRGGLLGQQDCLSDRRLVVARQRVPVSPPPCVSTPRPPILSSPSPFLVPSTSPNPSNALTSFYHARSVPLVSDSQHANDSTSSQTTIDASTTKALADLQSSFKSNRSGVVDKLLERVVKVEPALHRNLQKIEA